MASTKTHRYCIFCGKPGIITAEHCFGEWITRLFDGPGYKFKKINIQGQTINKWASLTIDLKTRSTCNKCNNGWMSDLENQEAKPLLSEIMLHGSPVTLLPRGIDSLAAFAFKGMVVADSMRPSGEEQFFPSSIRRQFSRKKTIPYGVHMWIGALHTKAGRHGAWHLDYGNGNGILNGFQFFIFTYAAGWLVFQVVASRWIKKSRRPFRIPIFQQDISWSEEIIQFWPQEGISVCWPGNKYLNEDSIQKFSKRWMKLKHLHSSGNLFISLPV